MKTRNPFRTAGAALIVALPFAASATDEQYTVTATRVERDVLRTPLAISTVEQASIQRRQQLGIDESMARIPGVFFQNRYNFAQDTRLSIRGFGARSQFGIRGVKIYVDGIPSTLPDGQGGIDDIDLNSAARIEVLRGPAAALYGASAGGVVNMELGEEQVGGCVVGAAEQPQLPSGTCCSYTLHA